MHMRSFGWRLVRYAYISGSVRGLRIYFAACSPFLTLILRIVALLPCLLVCASVIFMFYPAWCFRQKFLSPYFRAKYRIRKLWYGFLQKSALHRGEETYIHVPCNLERFDCLWDLEALAGTYISMFSTWIWKRLLSMMGYRILGVARSLNVAFCWRASG